MNKLREKFKESFPYSSNREFDLLEQITDDFTIKLLIWTANSEPIESIDYNKSDVEVATELLTYFKENVYGK